MKLSNKKDHAGLKLDETDIKNLENAIKIYEKQHPRGEVKYLEYEENGKKKTMIEFCNLQDHLDYMRKYKVKQEVGFKNLKTKSFDQPIKLRLSVPPSFEQFINKGYPTIFTDEKQTQQFLKAFPRFDLERN